MFRSKPRGFTLIEVTIILVVLALLAAILVPSLGGFNSLARKVRLREDLGMLCSTLKMMLDDVGGSAFFGRYGTYGGVAGASVTGFSTSGYGTSAGGETIVYRTTEPGDTAGVGDWCTNCDMPRLQCDDQCMGDCNDTCQHPVEPVVSTTTLIYESRGSASTGGAMTTGVGYRTYGSGYGSAYGYGAGYGIAGGHLGYPLGLLVGAGDVPATAIGATEWQLPLGSTFNATTSGSYPTTLNFAVGTFDDQLIHQDPTWFGVRAGVDDAAGYGAFPYAARYGARGADLVASRYFRWRGPYIADAVIPDPWGNRYMANVFGLHEPTPRAYGASYGMAGYSELFSSAVVCYSAGPNETIQTRFNQPWGWYTGGDDVTVVLAGAGGIR